MFKSFSIYKVVKRHYYLNNIRKKLAFILPKVSGLLVAFIFTYSYMHVWLYIHKMFKFVDDEETKEIRLWVLYHKTHVKHCLC